MDFVHLHLHSEYSLLDGVCKIEEIPKAAKALGQNAVAITDHGVMYGVVDFYNACIKENIKPIIGCEVYFAEGSRCDRVKTSPYFNTHLVLLVKNEIGYKNLCYIVSKSFTDGFYVKPRVDIDLLKTHADGLICLSGCLSGRIARSIILDDMREACSFASTLSLIFGKDNFYLELQDHGIEEQQKVNDALFEMSKKYGYNLVATNDVHYLKPSDHEIQTIMTCIQTGNKLEDGTPIAFEKNEFYLKSADEMYSKLGMFEQAIENTLKIADKCCFDFSFGKTVLPDFQPSDGSTAKAYLQKLAKEGLDEKIASGEIVFDENHTYDDYKSRMIYELLIISKMGYDKYYLIVWDFIRYAREKKIPVGPGRGSGAGSLVAYLIGITQIDSIKYDLLFERFLNPERVSMPDFDTDFCYNRREEVLEYVSEKYGRDHVSQIVTFGTMAAKAALRDVGRVIGMSYADVDKIVKMVPQKFGITLSEALEDREFKQTYNTDPKAKKLIDYALAIEGMPRHASTHAAGVVITKEPLSSYLPLSTNGDTVVTQFDMNTVASLGLLKFDFLALRYLTILSDAEKLVKNLDSDFSIDSIPIDDAATYDMISQGKVDGVFQLESAGMRRLLVNMKPAKIEDIMVAIALYRPGPMDSIPKYLENRENPDKISYKIPVLADILDSTYGCIIYQEQVMQICRKISGFSYGKADIIRKAMSKKNVELLQNERESFLKGAKANLYDVESANEIFDEMAKFAEYAFNKSHAAAYSVVTYRTAYMKCHYPAQFYASLLTSVIGNLNKTAIYIGECSKIGISVFAPDINESFDTFTVTPDNKNIRYGLCGIKSIGDGFVSKIIEERKKGKFTSFLDFSKRMIMVELTKSQMQSLICVGAFDSLGIDRATLMYSFEAVYELVIHAKRQIEDGQTDLFATEPENIGNISYEYPPAPPFTMKHKLALERQFMGVCIAGSMLDEYSIHEATIEKNTALEIRSSFDPENEDYGTLHDKQNVTLVGIINKVVKKPTKNDSEMLFVTLEDRTGEIEVLLFPKVYLQYMDFLVQDSAVSVEGQLSVQEDTVKIIAKTVSKLILNSEYTNSDDRAVHTENSVQDVVDWISYDDRNLILPNPEQYRYRENELYARMSSYSKLYLRVESLDSHEATCAVNVLEIFAGGKTQVVFYEKASGKYIKYNAATVLLDDYIIKQFENICGKSNVIVK